MVEFKLIQAVEQVGCEMVPEGENIRVMDIASLPASLKEKIREHKTKILEVLNRDNQARKEGFIIGLPGQVYFLSINKNNILYIEQLNGNWELWRETYQEGGSRSISIKVIYSGSKFENVILKAKSY